MSLTGEMYLPALGHVRINHMQINLVTSNQGKVSEFKAILGSEIKINHIFMEYRELRSDNPEEIAGDSAKILSEKLKKAVVVEDSGLFIKALNGFPGTCSSYIHKRIGLKGILKLMENISNRICYYKSAVAYCEPFRQPVSFLGIEEGNIAKKIRGSFGFGHDALFVPKGSKKTYGEMKNCGTIKKFRRNAIEKLLNHLNLNKNKQKHN